MKPALVLALVSMGVGACGQCPAGRPGFHSVDGSPQQVEWAYDTLDVFRNLVDVDASFIDLAFANDFETMSAACGSSAACTTPQSGHYLVTTFWPPEWNEVHPYLLAHELCHVHYLQTREEGDPNHTHAECFGRPGAYGGGEGYAWQTATELASHKSQVD